MQVYEYEITAGYESLQYAVYADDHKESAFIHRAFRHDDDGPLLNFYAADGRKRSFKIGGDLESALRVAARLIARRERRRAKKLRSHQGVH